MKKLLKMFGIIVLAAVIGFSIAACKSGDDDDDYDPTNPSNPSNPSNPTLPYNTLIDGVWKDEEGWQYSVNSGTATISTMGSMNTLWTNAVNSNYVKLGGKFCQNIKSTGNLTWSGQFLVVTYNTASPYTPTGTNWRDCTLTMTSNHQTVTLRGRDNFSDYTETWIRGSVYTLIGVWEPEDGGTAQITVDDGSSGRYTRMGSSAITQDAIRKGWVKNGDLVFCKRHLS